jgi:ankyrin repeat protein
LNLRVKILAMKIIVFIISVATVSAVAQDIRLVDAVKARDQNTVLQLLQDKINVNTTEADGSSALAWAAHWDDIKTAELLIRAGADANISNEYGISPLMLACINGSSSMVQKLLEARANPNLAQWMGVTPLMICSRSGSVESVKLLLTQDADVNARDVRRGQTALMWAASRQHPEVARVLTEYGADANLKTKMPDDVTPREFITYGVKKRDPTRTDIIGDDEVHLEITSSQGGFSALMFAARKGDIEMAKILVAAGADVNVSSAEYGNALVVAAVNNNKDFAQFLLSQKADPNVNDRWGFTPLHYSLHSGINVMSTSRKSIPTDINWHKPNMPELVESLLQHGADPNTRVIHGFPPFNTPAYARTTGNAMPEIRQPGATPFLLAAASFDVSLMRLLVSHGADPLLTTDEGTTPLMLAAGMGRHDELTPDEESFSLEASKYSVDLGIDVNVSNLDGRTALAAAAYMGANTVIQYLVSNGADMEKQDRYGQTALSIAQGKPYKISGADKRFRRATPHIKSAALLLSLGAKPAPQ